MNSLKRVSVGGKIQDEIYEHGLGVVLVNH